jgi:membrane-bound lytic murein transglycosylase A
MALLRLGLLLVVVSGAAALAGCGEKKPPAPSAPKLLLTRVEASTLPGWMDDRLHEALPALRRSCERLAGQPADRAVGPAGLGGTVADWAAPCAAAAGLALDDEAGARALFEAAFVPFALEDGRGGAALFTGYFEPELRGSRAPDAAHTAPLYRRPPDLVTVELGDFRADLEGQSIVGRVVDGRLEPYFTHEEIDRGALAGRALELVWIDDPIDVFFLHVQGSGLVRLADGGVMRVGYAAKNGHAFRAIGRDLIEMGVLTKDEVSMQGIRDWLRRNPDRARALMYRNGSYVFFREVEGEGPIGAQGVPLTPLRSLAVDPAFLPLGAPLWLDTTWPPGTPQAGAPLRRLVVAQDTGGAIKGPLRGDLFWGTGEAALAGAGGMKQSGRYFLFLPRAVAERRAQTS